MDIAKLEHDVKDAVSIAKSITINSNEDEAYALEFCKVIKRCQDEVGKEYDPTVESAYGTYKIAYNKRASYLDVLKEADKWVRNLIKDHRLKLELKRQKEENAAKARLDASVKKDQDALLLKAQEALDKGDVQECNRLANQAVSIEAGGVHVESKAVDQKGMTSAIVWKGRVVDLTQLPQEFLIITANQRAIDAHIKAHGKTNPIKGVEYYQDANLIIRK